MRMTLLGDSCVVHVCVLGRGGVKEWADLCFVRPPEAYGRNAIMVLVCEIEDMMSQDNGLRVAHDLTP